MELTPATVEVKKNLETKLSRHFGCTPAEASREQMYKAAALCVRDILTEKRQQFKQKVNKEGAKRVYYMCMEFLVGRSLKTNLCNLGITEEYRAALCEMGFELEELYECEPDAGLGNGGLEQIAGGELAREVIVPFLPSATMLFDGVTFTVPRRGEKLLRFFRQFSICLKMQTM